MEIGTAELATVLGIGERQIQKLEKTGVLAKTAHGSWPLASNVQSYLAHRVQSELRRSARHPGHERITELKTDGLALRNERESKALVGEARAQAIALFDELIMPLKPDMLSIPARVTNDLRLRRLIEVEINGVFDAAAKRSRAAMAQSESHRPAPGGDR